eukprot:5832614-Prorocentrum_lima.AAC.1
MQSQSASSSIATKTAVDTAEDGNHGTHLGHIDNGTQPAPTSDERTQEKKAQRTTRPQKRRRRQPTAADA